MPRLRTNNVFGTTTNNPLLVAGVTLNSAGLANLAAIAAPDVAVLTLDPNRVNGAPEIVHVTAHTGSATSATILRGQEGTAAREHPLGTFWVHAATVSDFGTDWAAWTPTFTNFTLGNGTMVARFVQVGATVNYRLQVTLGSTSAMGTGPRFSLPVTRATYDAEAPFGTINFLDAGTANHFGYVQAISTTTGLMIGLQGAANGQASSVTATSPFTWVATDKFNVVGTYEAA